jgi:hypothetical protein
MGTQFEPRGRGPPPAEFFVVGFGNAFVRVSPETAAELMRKLARRFPPRWLGFVDLEGSRIRVRSALVEILGESTPLQRERWRAFERARRKEEEQAERENE